MAPKNSGEMRKLPAGFSKQKFPSNKLKSSFCNVQNLALNGEKSEKQNQSDGGIGIRRLEKHSCGRKFAIPKGEKLHDRHAHTCTDMQEAERAGERDGEMPKWPKIALAARAGKKEMGALFPCTHTQA